MNLYQYAQNPLSYIDPLGLSCKGTANPKVKAAVERGKKAHKYYEHTLGGGV
ncbi:hypothetical protein [Klebsiella aerogenes]|uniref:hypothetical protein n=1 Tax=Klebsiella aerogenes TaxID=548 RepID=UPI00398C5478